MVLFGFVVEFDDMVVWIFVFEGWVLFYVVIDLVDVEVGFF